MLGEVVKAPTEAKALKHKLGEGKWSTETAPKIYHSQQKGPNRAEYNLDSGEFACETKWITN